jgi:hypothetical protein
MNPRREFIVKLIEFLGGKNIYCRIWWRVVGRAERVAEAETGDGGGGSKVMEYALIWFTVTGTE